MTEKEYNQIYIHYILIALGSAVTRAENNNLDKDPVRVVHLQNFSLGAMILMLVTIIEVEFVSKKDFTKLRNFEAINTIPLIINQTYLSSFIYLRDCFAHNLLTSLLSNGENTRGFTEAISKNSFPYAEIDNGKVKIKSEAIHNLHLIILELFKKSK